MRRQLWLAGSILNLESGDLNSLRIVLHISLSYLQEKMRSLQDTMCFKQCKEVA